MTVLTRFATSAAVKIEPNTVTPLVLEAIGDVPSGLRPTAHGVKFDGAGWYEVLLTVEWSPENVDGTRFSHTKIPDNHPLHSEAISASVLASVSGGRQLLRGNSVFGKEGLDEIALEVWHDANQPVEIKRAELAVRSLDAEDG
jgi:hypothetical protein